jgi:hypothetical protein
MSYRDNVRHDETCDSILNTIDNMNVSKKQKEHNCQQCGVDMGFEYLLGAVCGKCCRKNHRKVCRK